MATTVSKMDKAKANLVLTQPFFAALLLKYPLVAREDIPILAIDKRGQIYYNPKKIEEYSVPQITWGLCHEALHKALLHFNRIGDRDPKKWNYAGDAVINDILDQSKVGERIPHTVNMPGSKDKSTEEVYAELPDMPPNSGGAGGEGGGDPSGMGDDILDEGEPLSESEVKQMEAQAKVDLTQAANVARMKGKLPAHLQRFVDNIVHVKTPWYDTLERFMQEKVKQDTTWMRPNRRHIGQGIYLPSMDSVAKMGEMVVAIDTSGSIDDKMLAYFGGHLNRIIETCNPVKVCVIYCDAAVNHVDEFGPEEYPVKLQPHGGGGTSFRPVFDYIHEKGISPAVVVYLTDGYGDFPDSEDVPTVWAMTTNVVAPHGMTLPIDMKE